MINALFCHRQNLIKRTFGPKRFFQSRNLSSECNIDFKIQCDLGLTLIINPKFCNPFYKDATLDCEIL